MTCEPFSELTPASDEIEEHHVESVEIAISDAFNKSYRPHDGIAKWFRDELGNDWVKVYTAFGDDQEKCYCFPAERVRVVTYKARPFNSYDEDD